jgi:hypothetical protein
MPDGTAREAINVRPGSITGNAGGAEAIKGEIVQYPVPAGQNPEGYVLIGSCTCNNQLVEFWASESFDGTETYAPIVRVDGAVVAKSKNIPYVWNRPLQIAVADDFFGTSISANEDANGVVRGRGIVYPADHNSIPLYWDINQLVTFEQNGNLAYFGDAYQVGFNSVGLFNTPEFPVHIANEEVAGDIGLPCGQYQYALRYVTPQGDKTNIGPWTPLISVALRQSQTLPYQQSHYPGATTIGGAFGQQTNYGIRISFRVDNVFGFQFVEVVRKSYNTADNIGNNTLVYTLQISPNQNSIETFFDPVDGIALEEQEIITDEELNIKVMAINKPKAVEYSDRRLTYANFETFPKVAEDVEFIDRGSGTIFPITQGVCTRYPSESFDSNGENPREWSDGYYYWNDGYSDPVNNTYLKSFMRGERYGIGVMFWNQFAEQSFVTPVDLGAPEATNDGYLFPNRRDRRAGRSLQYSDGYEGVDPRSKVQAFSDINPANGFVGETFEAFSQGSVGKNIWNNSYTNQPWSGYDFINRIDGGGSFSPFGPQDPLTTSENNATNDQTRLSQSPNEYAYTQTKDTITNPFPRIYYSPSDWTTLQSSGSYWPDQYGVTGRVWAPRHYALGAAIEGIKNIPNNTKIISVMRTEPAGRVVAQGILSWNVFSDGGNVPGTGSYKKRKNNAFLQIPDFNNSVVSQDIIDQFTSNPNLFQIQFVSPLGFYTEQYSGAMRSGNTGGPVGGFPIVEQFGCADFLSYAGVQWDNGNQVNHGLQINAYEPSNPNGAQYVGYGAWRDTIGTTQWQNILSNQGNHLFDVLGASARSNMFNAGGYEVTLSDSFYVQDTLSSAPTEDAALVNTAEFHEPWYVVNIVLNNAKIANDQIDKYVETGYHIKTESCIGVTPSSSIGPNGVYQDFPLLNERLGDVYAAPQVPPLPIGSSEANRYVYVDSGEGLKPWLCVTDNDEANTNQATILSSLSSTGSYQLADGTVIYGIYSIVASDEWTSTSQKQFSGTVRFGQWVDTLNANTTPVYITIIPTSGSRIIVKYDKNEPIRFFGGDCTVSPSLNAIYNFQLNYPGSTGVGENDSIAQVLNTTGAIPPGLPMPYRRWSKLQGYRMPLISGTANNGTERYHGDNLVLGERAKRQWVVYWDAEQRSKVRHYAGTSANQGAYEWPRTGYYMQWGGYYNNQQGPVYIYSPYSVNGVDVLPAQGGSNPPDNNYSWGGFRLSSSINKNYTQQAPVSGFGVPFVSSGGEFTEKFYFPTGLIASLEFNQLAQDVPSLRTFLELNLKTISEENGEIKTIGSALAGGGRNLYAWTDNGVARVLTNKNVLTGADGSNLGTQSISNYWGQEMWISRNIGSPDQMWQMLVKGYAPAGNGYADSFFWPDRNSIYRMVGDSIIDIGREQILSYALPILRSYSRGYVPGISGIYNKKFNEAWMPIVNKNVKSLLVYNPEVNAWNGIYDYSFDGYTQVGNDVFGHRGLRTFKLDQGWTINAAPREASVTVPMVGDIDSFKEFIRWRVVGSKPDAMEILDPDLVLMSRMDATTNGSPLWVKEYDGWEGWASRTLASYDASRKLPQKRYFYLRVIWNREEDVNATSLSGQLKPIK